MTVIMKMRSWSKVTRKNIEKGLLALASRKSVSVTSLGIQYTIMFDEVSNIYYV